MTDVNKECIKLLEEHFVIQTLTEHVKQEAADGTIKFLFKLQDGNLIETVMMRHKYGISVCVTTKWDVILAAVSVPVDYWPKAGIYPAGR